MAYIFVVLLMLCMINLSVRIQLMCYDYVVLGAQNII